MLCRSMFVIALVCAIPSAYSYSSGAPEQACGDMIPQHHVDPQVSEAPYKLLLSTNQLRGDQKESVNIKIQGDEAGNTIKGFMLQARVGDEPVGKFTVKSLKHAQLLNCSNGKGNAMTHKKIFGNGPNNIEAVWTPPPNLKGEVKFYATVALNGGVFWVNKLIEPCSIV